MLPDYTVYLHVQRLTDSFAQEGLPESSVDANSMLTASARRGGELRRWAALRLRLLASLLDPESPARSTAVIDCA